MAKASIDTVTKTVTTEVDEEVIQLTLSKVEARALYALGCYVLGNTVDTYNREIFSIWEAVKDAVKIGYLPVYEYFTGSDLQAQRHRVEDK